MLPIELELHPHRRMLRVRGIPRPKPRMTHKDRYTPSKSVQDYRFWADLVRLRWREAFKGDPWLGPITLSCIFEFPIPASWNKQKTALALSGQTAHTSPPDLDNLIKGITDALNTVAWRDDCQIVGYFEPISKVWAPPKEAGAWITVEQQL